MDCRTASCLHTSFASKCFKFAPMRSKRKKHRSDEENEFVSHENGLSLPPVRAFFAVYFAYHDAYVMARAHIEAVAHKWQFVGLHVRNGGHSHIIHITLLYFLSSPVTRLYSDIHSYSRCIVYTIYIPHE